MTADAAGDVQRRAGLLAVSRAVLRGSERRWFAVGLLVNAVGNGLFLTVSALYFTRVSGIPLHTYGLVLTVAAAFGLVVGPVIGHQADRLGPRKLYVGLLLLQGAGTVGYLLTRWTGAVLVALVVVIVAERGAAASRGALIAALVPREGRVEFRAVVRTIVNAAGAAGAGLGTVVLVWDTPGAFRAAIIINAATFVVSAIFLSRCHVQRAPVRLPPRDASGRLRKLTQAVRRTSEAARNPGFVAVTALNAVLVLHVSMLTVALPLWIAGRTDAPLWTVSVLVIMNTLGVVLWQVRASRGIVDVTSAARAGRRAAGALALACVLLASTSVTSGAVTLIALVMVAAAHLGGELWQAASGWALSFELAPEEAIGQYQGVFNSGQDVGMLAAPLLFTVVVADWGAAGWFAVAAAFLLAGLLLPPVSRWALSYRLREQR